MLMLARPLMVLLVVVLVALVLVTPVAAQDGGGNSPIIRDSSSGICSWDVGQHPLVAGECDWNGMTNGHIHRGMSRGEGVTWTDNREGTYHLSYVVVVNQNYHSHSVEHSSIEDSDGRGRDVCNQYTARDENGVVMNQRGN